MSSPRIPQRTSSVAQNGKSEQEPWIIRGASEPLSVEGIVDLTNTVDTDVITQTLPAVTHEHVIPKVHEIRHEEITREIHKHDIFHRVLPVIETEILPAKHYVVGLDGTTLKEIPADMVLGRTIDGSRNRNWEIKETGIGRYYGSESQSSRTLRHKRSSSNLSADSWSSARSTFGSDSLKGPLSLVNDGGEPMDGTKSGIKNLSDPILSSKKEYMAKEGHPVTEYVWRHPPVFETTNGQIQPIYHDVERTLIPSVGTDSEKNIPGVVQGAGGQHSSELDSIVGDFVPLNAGLEGRRKYQSHISQCDSNSLKDVAVEHTNEGGLIADVERGMAGLEIKN
ncbi:hypothetical protein HYFRA_00002972 [Hymenoscyphus fraxineus]|uniref:Uncharacterized protein n=1 Tax=Hymenoscyphus fraxineus TaxID=746836 RepID=A0A9N9KN08_9HELO|nr:hypothetical protein HYFRA_00002972 [Hymenoscyphus fraxineus]